MYMSALYLISVWTLSCVMTAQMHVYALWCVTLTNWTHLGF